MNHELPGVQAGFWNGRRTRDQIANICLIIKKAREFQKNIYFCFILTVCITTNCGKFLKRLEYQTTLPPPEKNLYASQEATFRTGHVTTYWIQIGKGVCQGCILSPCLFNLYAEYIMWNAQLDKIEAGINFAGRNINNLRYADDTTFMAESKEELKSLSLEDSERGEWKSWLKTQHSES